MIRTGFGLISNYIEEGLMFLPVDNPSLTEWKVAAGVAVFGLLKYHKCFVESRAVRERTNEMALQMKWLSVQGQRVSLLSHGNIFAFGLFASPIPTFRRIIRNQSTENFSGLPYIYALLNCLICMWYGMPVISDDNVLLSTVNSFGALFQFAYIILFIVYADRDIKVRMLGLLLAVLVAFVTIVVVSLQIVDANIRRICVGLLSCFSLVSMFASPLFIINLVIQTKSVEFMPFYLSLSTFLMSTSFFVYGVLNCDGFVYVPNGLGTLLGTTQLILYFYYKKISAEDSREPLIVSYT